MKKTTFAAIAGCLAILAGCSTSEPTVRKSNEPTYEQVSKNSFVSVNQQAVEQLVKGLEARPGVDAPILVSTIVSINNLTNTSALGRTLSEQYASAMVSKGFNVKEMKLRDSIFMREETGELILSREVKLIAKTYNAAFVFAGTYSVADTATYVSVKLIRTEDGRIMSAYDYALPNDRNVKKLLN